MTGDTKGGDYVAFGDYGLVAQALAERQRLLEIAGLVLRHRALKGETRPELSGWKLSP